MAAAVRERGRSAVGIEKQHDVFIQERERPRAVLELADGHCGVPEAPQHRLLRDEHRTPFPHACAVCYRHESRNGRETRLGGPNIAQALQGG
jgi:hypothetical protein